MMAVAGTGYTCMSSSQIFLNSYGDTINSPFLDINNVGSMAQSLYTHNNPEYDEVQALRWQAAQVSAISLSNFGGRILIGTMNITFLTSLLLNFFIAQVSSLTLLRICIKCRALTPSPWLRLYTSFLKL